MTQDRIAKFILDRFPLARERRIGNNEPLLETGVIDSLGVLDVVAYLESEFGISIDDEELIPENFQSIERLTVFVAAKRKAVPEAQE